MKDRIPYWDMIKALTIFFVVWGHCMASFSGDELYRQHSLLSSTLYSFHMGLFMIVSGYFSMSSFNRPMINVLKKRFLQLIVPSVSWFILIRIFVILSKKDFTLNALANSVLFSFTSFWFLKALFVCIVLSIVGYSIYRRSKAAFGIYICVMLALLQEMNSCYTAAMLPFFLFGILLNRTLPTLRKYRFICIGVCLFFYLELTYHWRIEDYCIYDHPVLLENRPLLVLIIRTIIGISFSTIIILLFDFLLDDKKRISSRLLIEVGQSTLGIYCIQFFLAELFPTKIVKIPYVAALLHNNLLFTNSSLFEFVITPFASISIIYISLLIIRTFRKNRILSVLFLGEYKKINQ